MEGEREVGIERGGQNCRKGLSYSKVAEKRKGNKPGKYKVILILDRDYFDDYGGKNHEPPLRNI